MKILITGANGFVGERLLKALENTNRPIKIVSRKPAKPQKEHEIITLDLSRETIKAIDLEDVSTVIHLAAYTHDVNNSKENEESYVSNNTHATVELAKAAKNSGVKRFIFISSVKAGEANKGSESINERHIPQGIYGKTKRDAEIKLLQISDKASMNITILRPALIYGPGMKGNLAMMKNGMKRGWFPQLPEINNRRSMIHVDDLVRAILFLEKKEDSYGEIFIATDGKDYSTNQIQIALLKSIGKESHSWKIPKFLLCLISKINDKYQYKVNKLVSDEYYSSLKILELGFTPKLELKNINEKIF